LYIFKYICAMKNNSLETAFAQVQVLINDFEAGIALDS
jgi:hypothetical protein